jgi:hypothetical protein
VKRRAMKIEQDKPSEAVKGRSRQCGGVVGSEGVIEVERRSRCSLWSSVCARERVTGEGGNISRFRHFQLFFSYRGERSNGDGVAEGFKFSKMEAPVLFLRLFSRSALEL